MASNDLAGPAPATRWIRRLGIAAIVIVALYSAGWFFVASKIETYLAKAIDQSLAGKLSIKCDNLMTGGFPFHLGFTCDHTVANDLRTGATVSAGALNAAARLYDPGAAAIALKGPADILLADGASIKGNWDALDATLRAGTSGLSSVASAGRQLVVTLNSPSFLDQLKFVATNGTLDLANTDGNLDAEASATDFVLTGGGIQLLPRLSTSVALTIKDRGSLLEGARPESKAMSGRLRDFRIVTSEGIEGQMSGPFSIDEEGYISGTFKTKLVKLDLWEQHLVRVFPDARDTISGVAALLRGLAKGKDEVSVKLKVKHGEISLSFLPLGRIPPI